jgi:Protein of unknown function (DUF1236)
VGHCGTLAARLRCLFLKSKWQQEELMTRFWTGAMLTSLALVAGVGAAQAQNTVITRQPVETRTVVTTAPMRLTPVQRQTIYRTIVRERVAPVEPTVEYRVGMRIPESTHLYAVPQTVVSEVPAVQPYKYMVVNGKVLLVDPATSQVVAELAD